MRAYRLYVGGTPSAPTSSGSNGGGSGGGGGLSVGGYYASYPSASTIYCADDSEWQSLSKTYLVLFQTWAQAIKRSPDTTSINHAECPPSRAPSRETFRRYALSRGKLAERPARVRACISDHAGLLTSVAWSPELFQM